MTDPNFSFYFLVFLSRFKQLITTDHLFHESFGGEKQAILKLRQEGKSPKHQSVTSQTFSTGQWWSYLNKIKKSYKKNKT